MGASCTARQAKSGPKKQPGGRLGDARLVGSLRDVGVCQGGAVVNIPVQDGDLFDPVPSLRMVGGNGRAG